MSVPLCCANSASTMAAAGRGCATASNAPAKPWSKLGFAISAGEWQDDVHAVGVALKLNDGTGPYAFNCGAPAFRFTEDRLRNDIGPRLVAMVRNIEAALGRRRAAIKKSRKQKIKSRRESCTCG